MNTPIILPDNPMSVITLFDADKKGLDYFIDYVANTIEGGMDDPLKVQVICKKMEYVTKRLTERIKDSAEREAQKHGDNFTFMDSDIQLCAVKTDYDYSKCNYPGLIEAMEMIKENTTFLKSLKNPVDIRVEDQLVTVYPPIRKQVMGLKITQIDKK